MGKICLLLAVFFAYQLAEGAFKPSNQINSNDLSLDNEQKEDKILKLEQFKDVSSSKLFVKTVSTPIPIAPPPQATTLKFRLVGINSSTSKTGSSSFAIIEDSQKQIQDIFEKDDTIFGQAKLMKISSDRVEIERNGKIEVLLVEDDKIKGEAPGSSGQGEFNVSENELQQALENIPSLLSQARSAPHFRNGQSIGLRIYAIRPGSLYEKLGIQNGDILLAVNDSSLADPTQALKIFEQLKTEKNIKVKVERNGQESELKYSIK